MDTRNVFFVNALNHFLNMFDKETVIMYDSFDDEYIVQFITKETKVLLDHPFKTKLNMENYYEIEV